MVVQYQVQQVQGHSFGHWREAAIRPCVELELAHHVGWVPRPQCVHDLQVTNCYVFLCNSEHRMNMVNSSTSHPRNFRTVGYVLKHSVFILASETVFGKF